MKNIQNEKGIKMLKNTGTKHKLVSLSISQLCSNFFIKNGAKL